MKKQSLTIRILVRGLALLFVALSCTRLAAEVPRIPVEDFFRNPQFTSFTISPDGNTLAAIGEWENRRNLFVWDIANMEGRRLTGYRRNNVSGVLWASNERLLYFMDRDGNESLGIFAISKDGGRPRTLVEPQEGRAGGMASVRRTSVIDRLVDDPDHVLVTSNNRLLDYPDAFRLNVWRGGLDVVQRNPGDVVGWVPDWEGDIRIAVFSDKEEEKTGVRYRPAADAGWETLIEFGVDSPGWSPVGFGFDDRTLYISSNLKEDRAAIYEFDLKERKIGRRIHGHERFDVSNLIISRHHRAPIGVAVNAERPEVRWFSEERQQLQAILDRAFLDTYNAISSASLDETRLVVSSFGDRQPPKFHLVDFRGGEFRVLPLGETYPWLNPEHLAETRSYWITARDDRPMQLYLTVPRSREGDARVPLLVMPHGGPWYRDSWGYDPVVQFFANRGFAVLQMNFRGSTGFGREHLRSSFKQWGKSMQEDVIDAVDWAIEEGYADKSRVGIYGASYGGYTAMMQAILYPDRYRFAVNFLGPTDLVDLVMIPRRRQQEEAFAVLKRQIGDPSEEREMLEAASPVLRANEIKVPVFLAYGVQDPRVPIEHGTRMRTALRRAGVEYEWMSKRNEGHGFVNEENRIELYERIETFIEQTMGRL
ncbi:MAG: S9 family peptidase [Opitutales bacterium]|nr:S9 family peptidase [Opitutales bacterium]